MTPSEQRGVVDAARLRLKAVIKAAWSREAVTRGVAAAKKADYALAHRHATACASKGGCAGQPRSSWLTTRGGLCTVGKLWAGVAFAQTRRVLLGESSCTCHTLRTQSALGMERAGAMSAHWTWTRATQTRGWLAAQRSPTSSSSAGLLRTLQWHWVRFFQEHCMKHA